MATRLLEKNKWTKDGRKWVFYTWVPTLTGKRKKYTSRAYHTKKEALIAEREYERQRSLSNYKEDNDITFKDLYTSYFEYQKDKVKANTIRTYNDRIRHLKLLDNIKVNNLNGSYYELWRDEIKKLDSSCSYKNMVQKLLKAILNWGTKRYGYDFRDFYSKIENFNNPNELPSEMNYFTLEEFNKFISYEENLKYRCLFETLYYCGTRKGEARALTWNDIDFEEKELRISKNVISVGSESSTTYLLTTPKTKSSVRTIPIPDILIKDLKKLLEEDKKIYGFNTKWYIFGDDIPITNSKIRCHKNSLCKKAGLKQIRIHDFRHSCASLLINNGANITIVAKYLGHTKINETLNTYSHMFKNKLNDIVKTINKLT